MLLGGGYYGQRLNKIYRGSSVRFYRELAESTSTEAVSENEIVEILTPMFKSYAKNRMDGERFGDFSIRQGWITPVASGLEWYNQMTEGKAVEA
jgi:sulfite reductase (NADPH) hemoprotein beta-component